LSKVNANRRAFLRGAYLTREGRNEEAKRQKPLGPVPPWHQGLALESHCVDCTQPCIASCEPGIIKIHPQSHDYASIPYLDFTSSGCTFCGACVEACPIEIETGNNATPRIGTLVLNRSSCIAWQDIICMSCSNACEYKAITTMHQRRPQIVTSNCTGCGKCVSVCPVNAMGVL